MEVDKDLVRRIAQLAHLQLSDEEVQLFSEQLRAIVDYIEQIKEVDESSEPFSFPSHISGIQRSDEIRRSLPVEDALSNAPKISGHFFKVPRIIP